MNKRIKLPYLIIFIVQSLLAAIAFKDFRLHPSEVIFCRWGDGLKNYFTLLSYVKGEEKSLFSYDTFNYPFGEFVYTTDNTPLFAIPFKWFCQHIYDLSDHTLAIYNSFIVINIIICGLLCFAVLRKLIKHDLLSLIMSIVLSWSNMQLMRIWRGHFNLSLSSLILLAILFCIIWQEQKDNRRRQYLAGAGMIVLNYAAFLAHGYYIAIIGIFQAAILFFYGIYHLKSRPGKFSIAASFAIPAISIFLVLLTMKATDGFYALRSPGAGGYDWMEHKIRFWGFFTHYDFHRIHFPLKNMKGSFDPENMGYLGNAGLYTLLILLIAALASKTCRLRLKEIQQSFFTGPPNGPVFLGSLLMLIISFGELYYTEDLNGGILIYNLLNPLYLAHQFTDMVEQFRDLGRFAWPFFWGFNFWMLYTLASLYPQLSKQLRIALIAGLVFLGGSEVRDYVDAMQAKTVNDDPFNPKEYSRLAKLKIDYSRYQAMLALPYYNVGSENPEYILDDNDASGLLSFQMALHSRLPLMNVKLSRTVLPQARMLDSLVAYDSWNETLLSRINNKPILVFVDRERARDSSLRNIPNNSVGRDLYWKALELPSRHHLQPIDSLDNIVFYEWYPKPPSQ